MREGALFCLHSKIVFFQCSIQTWYLSAEMQLHVIGFLLLLAYRRSPAAAYLVSGGLVLFGLLLIGAIVASSLAPVSLFHIYTYTQYPSVFYPLQTLFTCLF